MILNKNRQSSDRDGTKLFLSEYFKETYEDAIDCSFLLFELNADRVFLEKANEFMAKSKGLLLLENLSGAEAINTLGLPDSILFKENLLKSEIAAISREINNRKSSGSQLDSVLVTLNQSLLDKTREQDIFKQQLQLESPNYYEFKYRYEYPKLSELSDWSRNSKATIIEYFYGDTYVFGLGVVNDNIRLFRVRCQSKRVSMLIHFIRKLCIYSSRTS